ncbi:hypothetical protein TMatcc_001555 [Talaromyces marneffei ATCC 18224]
MAAPPEDEEGLAEDPLRALPSALERLAVRAPSAPDKADAEIELALAHETTTGFTVSYHLQSSILTICEIEGRKRKIGQAEFAESHSRNGWAQGDVEAGARVGSQSEEV